MGIRQLWKSLNEVKSEGGRQLPLSKFKGKVVVVDVSIWLIEFLKGTRNRELISSWFNGAPHSCEGLKAALEGAFRYEVKGL